MRPNNFAILPAAAANATQTSLCAWAYDIVRASFQLVATGTAAGTIQVQISNDQAVGAPAGQYAPTNWSDLGTTVAVAGAGVYTVPAVECAYEYIRVVYTDTSSGSATGTVAVRMKSMGL